MLERWAISPLPSKTDPRRHVLWLKADMSDIQGLIRKFGALFGRPQKERKRKEYDYCVYLREASPARLQSIEKYIASVSPSAVRGVPEEEVQSAPPASIKRNPMNEPAATPEIEFPPADAPLQPLLQPAPGGEYLREGTRAVPPATEKDVAGRYAPGAAGKDVPPLPAAPTPPAGPEALWGAKCPLDPLFTFESLTVGPFNRFAHAASMAVVSNPGMIYNPLLLHGMPGVGKSHILMAIAHSLQQRNPETGVFFTTGPRLSRAVRLAADAGRMNEIEQWIKQSTALIIDDVHVLEITEQNQTGLITILNHYFNGTKPVIMASVYPPQALGAMEEALRFQIGSGWSVEMKFPSPEIQKNVVNLSLARAGFDTNEDAVKLVQENLKSNFYEFSRRLRHLKALSRIQAGQQKPADLHSLILAVKAMEESAAPSVTDGEVRDLASRSAGVPAENGEARPAAIFYPKGLDGIGNYILGRIAETAAANGVAFRWKAVVQQDYDAEQSSALPFLAAETADKSSAQTVLVLGPQPNSAIAGRESEIYHAMVRMMGSSRIAVGWIPYAKLRDPASFFRVLLDIFPFI